MRPDGRAHGSAERKLGAHEICLNLPNFVQITLSGHGLSYAYDEHAPGA